jgi:hypothetical protein
MSETKSPPITFFWKGIFSQWHSSPFECKCIDGSLHKFDNAEQYMMYNKACTFPGNEKIAQRILSSSDPSHIKNLGRQVQNFTESGWKKMRMKVVIYGNYAKFTQNPTLKNALLNTKNNILAEASPYDTIWGIGMSSSDSSAKNPKQWKGTNLLGIALMKVRECILNNVEPSCP